MGSSNSAQKQAESNQKQQDAQIASAQSGINAIYDNPARQGEYDKLGADTTQYYTNDLNQQQHDNSLKLKFAMARGGLSGGSEQAYQGQRLGQDYQKGLIQATRQGQQAEASLKNADETSRMNLLNMAQSGLTAGDATNRATEALQGNLQSSQAGATADQLGNAFSDFSNIYQSSQDQKALRQGQLYGYGSMFSPMFGAGGQQGNGNGNGGGY